MPKYRDFSGTGLNQLGCQLHDGRLLAADFDSGMRNRFSWPRKMLALVAAFLFIGLCSCGQGSGSEPAVVTTANEIHDGTSIDRSGLPSGAAPGDGSGQGKTPEGNTNSGGSPAGTVSGR